MVLFRLLRCISLVGADGVKMGSFIFLKSRMEILCPPLFRKPSQMSKQSPLLYPWLLSDPRLHPVFV